MMIVQLCTLDFSKILRGQELSFIFAGHRFLMHLTNSNKENSQTCKHLIWTHDLMFESTYK